MTAIRDACHIGASMLLLAAAVSHEAAAGRPACGSRPTRPMQVRVELVDDARYRAIFCGGEGTETGAAYARTLARDLERLEATGRTTTQSLEYIRAEACDRPGLSR